MTEAPKHLLNRDLVRATVAAPMEYLSPMMQEMVNYGLGVLTRCTSQAGGSLLKPEDETVLSLFRQTLTMLDGIEIAVREGGTLAAMPTLRSLYESFLAVSYIAEGTSADQRRDRGRAHRLVDLIDEMHDLKRFDASSDEGKQLRAIMQKDELGRQFEFPVVPDLIKRIEHLQKQIDDPVFDGARSEYGRVRASKKGTVVWHELFAGRRKMEDVATDADLGTTYQILFRYLSMLTHPESTARHREGESWRPIRQPNLTRLIVNTAVSLTKRAMRTVIAIYRPFEAEDATRWYVTEIQPRFAPLFKDPPG
jgi:hypothetical protein